MSPIPMTRDELLEIELEHAAEKHDLKIRKTDDDYLIIDAYTDEPLFEHSMDLAGVERFLVANTGLVTPSTSNTHSKP